MVIVKDRAISKETKKLEDLVMHILMFDLIRAEVYDFTIGIPTFIYNIFVF